MDDFYKSLVAFYNRHQSLCILAMLFILGGLLCDLSLSSMGSSLRVVAVMGTLVKTGKTLIIWMMENDHL